MGMGREPLARGPGFVHQDAQGETADDVHQERAVAKTISPKPGRR